MDALLGAMGVNFAEQHRAMAHAKLHRDPECYVIGEYGVPTPRYAEEAEHYRV
jgi:hypothetical protein